MVFCERCFNISDQPLCPICRDPNRDTTRLCVVEEGPRTGGWAGELLAAVTERKLEDLDDAWRVATLDHPVPYSPPLEDAFLPGPDRIVAEVRERLGQ